MRYKKEDGQAMVEFALVLPILIILICGIIDFGWIAGNQLLLNNASKEATRFCAIHSDLSQSDLQLQAENVVMDREKTLFDAGKINVSVNENTATQDVSVTVKCDLSMVTPLSFIVFGPSHIITATSTMRAES